MKQKLWEPSEDRVRNALLSHFIARAEHLCGQDFASYDALWEWSVEQPASFWRLVWDFCGVLGDGEPGPALQDNGDLIDTAFFPEARLNFARNLLQLRGTGPAIDRKSTRLNSSHRCISYAVFCLKKKNKTKASP